MKNFKVLKLQKLVLSIAGIILLMSCGNISRVSSIVYTDMYRIDNGFEHDAYVRQYSQDSAKVIFKINTQQLLAKRKSPDSEFQLTVDFDVQTSRYGTNLVDSARHRYTKSQMQLSDEVVYGEFSIALSDTAEYEVRIRITDSNSQKNRELLSFLTNYRGDARYSDFQVNGIPSRYCQCEEGDNIKLNLYRWPDGQSLINEFDVESDLAPPPFSISGTPIPESTLRSSREEDLAKGLSFECPDAKGIEIYNQENNQRVWISVFQDGYPYIDNHTQMVDALKYITTSNEYKAMSLSENPRREMEDFWLNCAGSRERAKVLISNYYSRVEEANLYFAGRTEGWKTDRGLVHVVYGPPTHVVRYPDREVWIYGAEQSENALKMTFYRDDVYRLDRSLDYRQSWYLTVDSWRNGRTINQ